MLVRYEVDLEAQQYKYWISNIINFALLTTLQSLNCLSMARLWVFALRETNTSTLNGNNIRPLPDSM